MSDKMSKEDMVRKLLRKQKQKPLKLLKRRQMQIRKIQRKGIPLKAKQLRRTAARLIQRSPVQKRSRQRKMNLIPAIRVRKQRKRSFLEKRTRRTKKTRRLKNLPIVLPVRWQSLITSANVQRKKNLRCTR